MSINDEDVGFGASTVKVVEAPKMRRRGAPIRKVTFTCDDCGEESLERKFFCTWDVANQRWEVGECDDCDDYCGNCGCETYFTEVDI